MESFCPLCEKNGMKRRLKAYQINLEEAVWACMTEDCPWPINYEELTFFARPAASCNWKEPSLAKDDVPALIELSLYTPPVTPGGELSKELSEIEASIEYSCPPTEDRIETLLKCEVIASSKESTGSNKSSLFDSLELGDVSSKGNRSTTSEEIVAVRTLPKIVNIEKTNINLTILHNVDKHCDNQKLQERSLMDTTIMDTFKDFDVSNSACMEFGSSMQYKTRSEQIESGTLQSDAAMSGLKTNFGVETLSETMETLVDLNVTNNVNATNEFAENISSSDIDVLLEDIFKNENNIPVDLNDDWLSMLMS